jgi:N-methylhydantoinase B/oxoprolinase/acetone carboxylase alpha subunit
MLQVNDRIPLNAGCLKPLNIIFPEETMINPVYPAAVVAGNVEVSQTITDCLFGALGRLAASQGYVHHQTTQYACDAVLQCSLNLI